MVVKINKKKQQPLCACNFLCFRAKRDENVAFFSVFANTSKSSFFDSGKTPLRWLLDAIIMLTFFDAVVIAIRTCCYRDDNMMLST